jgi:subfamily B ATP-binding cassette protein MsbA
VVGLRRKSTANLEQAVNDTEHLGRMKGITLAGNLLRLFRFSTWGFPVIVVLGVLQSLSEGVGIGLFIPLLTGLVAGPQPRAQGQWLVRTMEGLFQGVAPDRRLAVIVACIFAAILATALLSYLHNLLFGWLDGHIAHDLRRRIFGQLMAVDFGFIERDRSGRLLNILASDSWQTSEALKILVRMMITAATIAVYVTLLLLVSWRLTLVVTVGVLAISSVVRLLTRAARELGETVKESNAELADRMVEGIDGMRVIRAFGQERREQRRFDLASNRLRAVMLRLSCLDGVVHPVHEVLAASLLLLILLIAAPTERDVPVLLVFAFVLYRLQPRVKEFDASRVRLAVLSASVEEVLSFLDTTDKQYLTSGTLTQVALDRHIEFERVSFQYDAADAPALTDASFRIRAGGTTAFVGPSGGGKSTIMKLLLRFHDPTSGSIAVDGHPLHDFDLDVWRAQIALVAQDVYLFNTTVAENIAYGRPETGRDEVVEAARKADAHEFIERLPDQYDTVLGHHGMRLSGGQQQRLSLARAIIRNPRVLILDEATNALDSISEHWIQETLDRMRENRTVIMIAHRLSTIERADQIVVLEKGRVQEIGSLPELMAAGGLFARLYHLQHRPSLAHNG